MPSTRVSTNGTTNLALRHLRGYPLRSYRIKTAGLDVTLSGPMRPEDLLSEPRTEQRFQTDDYMPYWADLWPASVGLAEFLAFAQVKPPSPAALAVELGSGLGLASIAAGLLGWQVLLTDYDADALTFALYNARTNGLQNARAMLLDWRQVPPNLSADLVLAADILYEPKNHAALLRCIETILKPQGVVLVADPYRDVAQQFLKMARRTGWRICTTPWPQADLDRQVRMHIHSLCRS